MNIHSPEISSHDLIKLGNSEIQSFSKTEDFRSFFCETYLSHLLIDKLSTSFEAILHKLLFELIRSFIDTLIDIVSQILTDIPVFRKNRKRKNNEKHTDYESENTCLHERERYRIFPVL